MSEQDACRKVAGEEFRNECGACNPANCPLLSQHSYCGCRECEDIWDIMAGDHTCGARIIWLLEANKNRIKKDVCLQISIEE